MSLDGTELLFQICDRVDWVGPTQDSRYFKISRSVLLSTLRDVVLPSVTFKELSIWRPLAKIAQKMVPLDCSRTCLRCFIIDPELKEVF